MSQTSQTFFAVGKKFRYNKLLPSVRNLHDFDPKSKWPSNFSAKLYM